MDATVAFNRQSDVVSTLYTGALQHKAAIEKGKKKNLSYISIMCQTRSLPVRGMALVIRLSGGCSCSF